MISLEEVKHISQLARVYFSDEELKNLQKELSSILDYIDKLKEVDIEGVEEMSHSVLIKNVLREDKLGASDKELIDLAPEKEKHFIKVKSIFKK